MKRMLRSSSAKRPSMYDLADFVDVFMGERLVMMPWTVANRCGSVIADRQSKSAHGRSCMALTL